jgi:fibronectin type 3 domain-containing protein
VAYDLRQMRVGLFRFLFCLALTCVAPLTLPGENRGARHRAKHHSVHLHWDRPIHSPDRVAGYNVYRSMSGESAFQKLNRLPIRPHYYNDHKVEGGKTYSYYVKSVDAKGRESQPSNWITLKVPSP